MLLGTDIEVWAVRAGHDGSSDATSEIVPAGFAIGDTRIALPWGEAYPDGAAVEFTVAPSGSPEEMSRRIHDNMLFLEEVLNKEGLHIAVNSNGYIGMENIMAVPLELDEFNNPTERSKRICLQILGCNPDLNVYDDYTNRPDPRKYAYRTLGGHIHIGLPDDVMQSDLFDLVSSFIVMMSDLRVGVLAANIARTSGDIRRRALYGRAGTYRVKPYGVEYRVPPSKVLTSRYSARAFHEALNSAEHILQRVENLDYDLPLIPQLLGIEDQELEHMRAFVNTSKGSTYIDNSVTPITEVEASNWRAYAAR